MHLSHICLLGSVLFHSLVSNAALDWAWTIGDVTCPKSSRLVEEVSAFRSKAWHFRWREICTDRLMYPCTLMQQSALALCNRRSHFSRTRMRAQASKYIFNPAERCLRCISILSILAIAFSTLSFIYPLFCHL